MNFPSTELLFPQPSGPSCCCSKDGGCLTCLQPASQPAPALAVYLLAPSMAFGIPPIALQGHSTGENHLLGLVGQRLSQEEAIGGAEDGGGCLLAPTPWLCLAQPLLEVWN